MARVGWGLGEDEGQWTFPGFLGFLHFWVRCYDTVMEGRFSRGLEANSLQVGGRSSVRKQLWAAMTGRQACPCPIGTTAAQTHHVQMWAHSAVPRFKRNWKSECCATFPSYREVAWKTAMQCPCPTHLPASSVCQQSLVFLLKIVFFF